MRLKVQPTFDDWGPTPISMAALPGAPPEGIVREKVTKTFASLAEGPVATEGLKLCARAVTAGVNLNKVDPPVENVYSRQRAKPSILIA